MERTKSQIATRQMSKTVVKDEMSQKRKLFTMSVTKIAASAQGVLSMCYVNKINRFVDEHSLS